jgi:hypothetical protein
MAEIPGVTYPDVFDAVGIHSGLPYNIDSHGSEPIHENGKRERAPALMRGIADRDESRSAGLSISQPPTSLPPSPR